MANIGGYDFKILYLKIMSRMFDFLVWLAILMIYSHMIAVPVIKLCFLPIAFYLSDWAITRTLTHFTNRYCPELDDDITEEIIQEFRDKVEESKKGF